MFKQVFYGLATDRLGYSETHYIMVDDSLTANCLSGLFDVDRLPNLETRKY